MKMSKACFNCFGFSNETNLTDGAVQKKLSTLPPSITDEMRKSWQKLCTTQNIGENILASLISSRPIFATFFAIEGTQLTEMKQTEKFRIQAQRIQGFLDTSVFSLGNISEASLRQQCRHIGKLHFYHGVNFSPQNWVIFCRMTLAVLQSQNSSQKDKRLHPYWQFLLEVITEEMNAGFYDEAKKEFDLEIESNGSFEQVTQSQSSSPTSQTLSQPRASLVPVEHHNQVHFVNSDELEICRHSWQVAKANDIGMTILLSLIDSKPDFATHFGAQPGVSHEELKVQSNIKIQASRIQGFMDTVLTLYDAVPQSKIQAMCHRIGWIHFHKGVNFTADNWLLYKRVTICQVVKNSTDKDSPLHRRDNSEEIANRGWEKLMRFIVRSMKEGFLRAASGSS